MSIGEVIWEVKTERLGTYWLYSISYELWGMSFLAFVLNNSGCIRRIRSIWLSIFLVIF